MEEFILPDFLKGQSVDEIHNRMLAVLPSEIDATEGGFPWDFTRPTALEKSELIQFHLAETLKLMHPMWADGIWLDYHATGIGLRRKAATRAYGKIQVTGIPGTEIPEGFIFAVPSSNSPAIEFETLETNFIPSGGTALIAIQARDAGIIGNVPAASITIMANPLSGIISLTNTVRTSGGTECEDDESLRQRIMEINQSAEASYIGCSADYIRWAKEIDGVGEAFVLSERRGEPNNVTLLLMDGNGEPANEQLISAVYNHIISPQDRIKRKAPIGARLDVIPPVSKIINYSFALVLDPDVSLESVRPRIYAALRNYYPTARKEKVVRYSRICSLLIDIPGIFDYTSVLIDGGNVNIPIEADEYPITGTLNLR